MQNIIRLTFATSCLATWNGHAEVVSCEQGKNKFHLLRFRLVEFCSTVSVDLGAMERNTILVANARMSKVHGIPLFAHHFFLFVVWLLLHPPVVRLILLVGVLQFKWEKQFQPCSKLCLKLRRRRILGLYLY